MDPSKLSELYIAYKTGPYAYQTPESKFWGLVTKGADCWGWEGKKDRAGRGIFPVRGTHHLAYRLSFIFERGPIPEDLMVCHHCDNPGCVNPDHLFVGTHQENMDDKVRKGRQSRPRGDKCGKAKLNWNLVFAMRQSHRQGARQKDLADRYGISQKQVSIIISEKQWILDFDTYQRLCLERCIYPNQGKNLMYTVLGLLGEAGEIAEKIKKMIRDDEIEDLNGLPEEKKTLLTKELGDVLFYIAAIAFELGVPLSEIARMNVNKLSSRSTRGTIQGSGDDR